MYILRTVLMPYHGRRIKSLPKRMYQNASAAFWHRFNKSKCAALVRWRSRGRPPCRRSHMFCHTDAELKRDTDGPPVSRPCTRISRIETLGRDDLNLKLSVPPALFHRKHVGIRPVEWWYSLMGFFRRTVLSGVEVFGSLSVCEGGLRAKPSTRA